jgi:hypothetical protein
VWRRSTYRSVPANPFAIQAFTHRVRHVQDTSKGEQSCQKHKSVK